MRFSCTAVLGHACVVSGHVHCLQAVSLLLSETKLNMLCTTSPRLCTAHTAHPIAAPGALPKAAHSHGAPPALGADLEAPV